MNKQEEQWLTGFTEGDGSVGLYNTLRVDFYQKERAVLDYICTILDAGNVRAIGTQHILTYHGKHSAHILPIIAGHVVSMHTRERLNNILALLKLPSVATHEPTIDWLTGFWDAEGSSGIHPSLNIAQKERDALDAIKHTFGGNVYQHHPNGFFWQAYGDNARHLLQELANRSHHPTKIANALTNFSNPALEKRKEDIQAYNAAYYDQHKEDWQTHNKSYHEQHREQIHAHHKADYARRAEESKRVRDYIKTHPEVVAKLTAEGKQ